MSEISEVYGQESQIFVAVAIVFISFIVMKLIKDLLNWLADRYVGEHSLLPARPVTDTSVLAQVPVGAKK